MAAVDPLAVTKMLQVNGIVLDSIMVGEGSNNKIVQLFYYLLPPYLRSLGEWQKRLEDSPLLLQPLQKD
jgi:hypothetical protein